jgi:hypothetical protein
MKNPHSAIHHAHFSVYFSWLLINKQRLNSHHHAQPAGDG